jgi:hypothetical protein
MIAFFLRFKIRNWLDILLEEAVHNKTILRPDSECTQTNQVYNFEQTFSENPYISQVSTALSYNMNLKENSPSTTDSSSLSSAASNEKAGPSVEVDDDEQSLHVKFQNIEIRQYGMTLGDNPSCTYGPPVSLDWDYNEANVLCLDEYEEARGRRRKSYQMQMNARHRRELLSQDFTEDEIKRTVKEVKAIKKNRERTKMMLPFMKFEDAAESAKRKAARAVA